MYSTSWTVNQPIQATSLGLTGTLVGHDNGDPELSAINFLRTLSVPEWSANVECSKPENRDMFFDVHNQQTARRVTDMCDRCPVRALCAQKGLDNEEQFGIWGGINVYYHTSTGRSRTQVRDRLARVAAGESPAAIEAERNASIAAAKRAG